MVINRQSILRSLKSNMPKISKLGIRRIALFGSYVHGTQTEDSDIDLLVEFREGEKTFDNFMSLKELMENMFGKRVDIVLENRIKTAMKKEISRSAVYAEAS